MNYFVRSLRILLATLPNRVETRRQVS